MVDVPFKPIMNEDIKHMHKDLFNEQSFNSFNPDLLHLEIINYLIMTQNRT